MGRFLHGVGGWKTQSIKASTSDVCYFNGSGFVLLWSIKFFTHRPHVKTDPFFFFNPIFVYKVRKKAEKTCIINAALSFEWVRLEWATHGIVLLWVIKFSTHRPHVKTDRAGPVQFYTWPFYRLFFVLGPSKGAPFVFWLSFYRLWWVWMINFFTPKLKTLIVVLQSEAIKR